MHTTGPGMPRKPSAPDFPGGPWGPTGPVLPAGPSAPASPCVMKVELRNNILGGKKSYIKKNKKKTYMVNGTRHKIATY